MSKINTKHFADDSVTFAKMANDIVVAPPTTALSTSPNTGQLEYNTVTDKLNAWSGSEWLEQ